VGPDAPADGTTAAVEEKKGGDTADADDGGVALERGDSLTGVQYQEASRAAAVTQPPAILRNLSEEIVER
jgi:hypothetical protein